ncbi:MAG: ABC transporter substrate-binding protein [Terrimesophilobacter sp.]
MRRNALVLTAFAVSIVAALTSCSAGGAPPEAGKSAASEPITIAVMSGITTEIVMQNAIDRGTFKNAGLDAKLLGMENPPAALAAMQGGSANFSYAPLPTALTALSKGIDIKIVAPADGFPDDGKGSDVDDDTALFVNPKDNITSPAQLNGQNVAVPSRSGLMEIAISGAVKQAGGDPSTIKWLALDQQSQLTSLTQGRIHAAGLSTPFSDRAAAQGMKLLVRPVAAFFEHGVAGVWITTGSFAKEHPDVVAKFQKGTSEANTYADAHIKDIADQVVKQQKLDIPASEVVVGYFPAAVRSADVKRANEKMAVLGFLSKPLDLTGVVIEAK